MKLTNSTQELVPLAFESQLQCTKQQASMKDGHSNKIVSKKKKSLEYQIALNMQIFCVSNLELSLVFIG